MLKVNVNGNHSQIEATGETTEIMTDLCLVIKCLYSTMHNQNKQLAMVFRKGITRVCCDPDSALWDTDAMPGEGLMIAMPGKREGERNAN